jgi:hypothetical protein
MVTENPYLGLRELALRANRPRAGDPTCEQRGPWGVVVDIGLREGAVTIFALCDGNASVYLSSGGGFIGGLGHEPIRDAAKSCVTLAAGVVGEMRATSSYPLPAKGEATLYALTDAGVLSARAPAAELAEGRHLLSPLFGAAQRVVAEYRVHREGQPTE